MNLFTTVPMSDPATIAAHAYMSPDPFYCLPNTNFPISE